MGEPYEFGARVRARRNELRFTVRDAAKRLGISPSRLAAVERGRSYSTDATTRPSRELVERFARIYGLPQDVLLAAAGYDAGVLGELDDDARHLLIMFNSLPADQKRFALDIMQVIAKRVGTPTIQPPQ